MIYFIFHTQFRIIIVRTLFQINLFMKISFFSFSGRKGYRANKSF